MKKAKGLLLGVLAMSGVALASCGGSEEGEYVDGTYTGQSTIIKEVDEDKSTSDEVVYTSASGYGVVTITIEKGEIADCDFKTYTVDGVLKDENYGSDETDHNRQMQARTAYESCQYYANLLVETGSLSDVTKTAGATYNYNLFVEAVEIALDKASKETGE